MCKNYACEVQIYTQVCFLEITRRVIQIPVEFFHITCANHTIPYSVHNGVVLVAGVL